MQASDTAAPSGPVTDEAESSAPNADDVMHSQLEAAWKYIHGMLVNLKALPLDRCVWTRGLFSFLPPAVLLSSSCSVALTPVRNSVVPTGSRPC